MAIFIWSDKYSVGVDRIDVQHKKLFGIINTLFDSMSTGVDRAKLKIILQGLVDYTKEHFDFEERMLSAAGYPQLAGHKQKHAELVNQIKEFVNAYNNGDNMTLLRLSKFLKDWLCNHIMDTDKLYSECVKNSGAAA